MKPARTMQRLEIRVNENCYSRFKRNMHTWNTKVSTPNENKMLLCKTNKVKCATVLMIGTTFYFSLQRWEAIQTVYVASNSAIAQN